MVNAGAGSAVVRQLQMQKHHAMQPKMQD
jgi:hypothetical protein